MSEVLFVSFAHQIINEYAQIQIADKIQIIVITTTNSINVNQLLIFFITIF
jgi:hypothetical protein